MLNEEENKLLTIMKMNFKNIQEKVGRIRKNITSEFEKLGIEIKSSPDVNLNYIIFSYFKVILYFRFYMELGDLLKEKEETYLYIEWGKVDNYYSEKDSKFIPILTHILDDIGHIYLDNKDNLLEKYSFGINGDQYTKYADSFILSLFIALEVKNIQIEL